MNFPRIHSILKSVVARSARSSSHKTKTDERMKMDGPSQCDKTNAISSVVIVVAFCCCLFLILVSNGTTVVITSQDSTSLAILWIASLLGGYLFQIVNISLLGSLVVGILLKNIFDYEVPPQFSDLCRTVGLTTILLMSSLEIDIDKIWQVGVMCLRLTFLPGFIEAIVSGAMAVLMFDMPFALALSLGYILSAVSPAIVVPGMIRLQDQRYGVAKGIPSLVMAAASFDDIAAITGFTVCIGIAMDTESDNVLLSAFIHGPLQICLGLATGCFFGIILALAQLCSHQWQRSLIAVELGILMTYFYKSVHLDGVGAIGTLVMGMVASAIWKQQRTIDYANIHYGLGTNCASYLHHIGRDLNIFWEIAVRPLLFGSIGAVFDFKLLTGNTILKSSAIVVIGVLFRLVAAYSSVGGRNLTKSERQFVAAAWLPKATVQAALCTLPLALVERRMSTSDNYQDWLAWGQQMMTSAILAILITAPMGLILIQFLGPRLLSMSIEETEPCNAEQKSTKMHKEPPPDSA